MLLYLAKVAVIITAIVPIVLMYHIYSQRMWSDIFEEENEDRIETEVDRRIRNAKIRVRQRLVIVDEMNKER